MAQSRFSRGFRKVFGKIRKVFASFSKFRGFGDVLGPVETCLDLFGPARMHSDNFGSVRKPSDVFGFFRSFSTFFALVPNTGEADGEMCTPNALEISEMCALKPFSCLFAALAEKTKIGFAGNHNQVGSKTLQKMQQQKNIEHFF